MKKKMRNCTCYSPSHFRNTEKLLGSLTTFSLTVKDEKVIVNDMSEVKIDANLGWLEEVSQVYRGQPDYLN